MIQTAQRLLRASLPLCLMLTATFSGCGWQLRGTVDLPQRIAPVYLRGVSELSPMTKTIERALEGSGIRVTHNAAEAASVLHLLSDDAGRRVLSVDGRGKALEYELFESVRFELLDAGGKPLVDVQRVSSQLPFLNPEIETLGKQREEEDNRRAMREDLAVAILERLRAQLR